ASWETTLCFAIMTPPDAGNESRLLWGSAAAAGGRAPLAGAPRVDVLERDGQEVELSLPVFAVAVDPDCRSGNRPGPQAAAADSPGASLLYEAGPHEHLDMPRHRLQRDVEGRRQLGHQQRLLAQPFQDRAPHRVREREEHAIEQLGLWVLHLVDE